MSENTKKIAETAVELVSSIPADKREIAVRLAETYATGLAVDMELSAEAKAEEREEAAQ